MPAPRALQGIGTAVFLSEYDFFANLPDTPTAVSYLMEKGISNESGAKIRVNYAREIFKDKQLLKECLDYITKAPRANTEQKEIAHNLLKKCKFQ